MLPDLHTDFSRGRSHGLIFPSLSEFLTVYCGPHTVKGFGIVNKAEIDVFLEFSCFFHDPADVGNLISGSSAFSKTSLNIRKFTIHILLKPGLENFEHYFLATRLQLHNDNYRTFGTQNRKVKVKEEKPKKHLEVFLYILISTIILQFPFSLFCYPHSTKTSLDIIIIHHFNNLLPNTLKSLIFSFFFTTC